MKTILHANKLHLLKSVLNVCFIILKKKVLIFLICRKFEDVLNSP